MSAKNFYIKASVSPVTPSGIAYFEPNNMSYPLPSFALYDDGWRVTNNAFRVSNPSYPVYYQKLDLSAATPYSTLLHNNIHGTKDRFTRVDGTTTTVTTNNVIIRDHLTRREWIEVTISSTTWVNLLSSAFAQGFYLPSQAEFLSVRNNTTGTVNMLGRTMIPSGQGQSFGTTDFTNTANYLGSNNGQVPYTSYVKTNNRPTSLLCRIF